MPSLPPVSARVYTITPAALWWVSLLIRESTGPVVTRAPLPPLPNQTPGALLPPVGTTCTGKLTRAASSMCAEMLLNDEPGGKLKPASLTIRLVRACNSKSP